MAEKQRVCNSKQVASSVFPPSPDAQRTAGASETRAGLPGCAGPRWPPWGAGAPAGRTCVASQAGLLSMRVRMRLGQHRLLKGRAEATYILKAPGSHVKKR